VQKSPTGTSTQSATLIGLLADEQRLRVVAAIALGARTIEAAAAAADTDLATVQSVLPRLVSAGLIEQRDRV
jgi:predicted transcriptional regulator